MPSFLEAPFSPRSLCLLPPVFHLQARPCDCLTTHSILTSFHCGGVSTATTGTTPTPPSTCSLVHGCGGLTISLLIPVQSGTYPCLPFFVLCPVMCFELMWWRWSSIVMVTGGALTVRSDGGGPSSSWLREEHLLFAPVMTSHPHPRSGVSAVNVYGRNHDRNWTSTFDGMPASATDADFVAGDAPATSWPVGPGIQLKDVSIMYAGGGMADDVHKIPPHPPTNYPPRYLGVRPSYGFFIRNVGLLSLVLSSISLALFLGILFCEGFVFL